nr:hypothetical protein [Ktedonobacter sp. SOSP1-52]
MDQVKAHSSKEDTPAEAFKQDLPQTEVHLLDTGHFALEEDGDVIAEHIIRFLTTKISA